MQMRGKDGRIEVVGRGSVESLTVLQKRGNDAQLAEECINTARTHNKVVNRLTGRKNISERGGEQRRDAGKQI